MKKILLFLVCMMAFTSAYAVGHRIGTYNIRTTGMEDDTGEKAWSSRRAAVVTMIRDTMRFDIVGLQEVSGTQYDYLKDKLGSTYAFVRQSSSTVNLLLYRKSKYNCLSKGSYYLAPNTSSTKAAWDARYARFTVWAKLEDKTTGEIIVAGATHLDLYPISIREGARVNTEQLPAVAGNYACIVMGDMNCEPSEHDPHANYGAVFGNARLMSKTAPRGSYYTWGSGMSTEGGGKLLDYMYVRNAEVESYYVSEDKIGRSLFPSDHLPVLCEITPLSPTRKTTQVVENAKELIQALQSVQPNDIVYLKDGLYDLGDSTIVVANTCVIQGSKKARVTGAKQLLTTSNYISLEIRGVHFVDATCGEGVYGSIVSGFGNYLKLTDCTFENCKTEGLGMVYAKDCQMVVDHCVFRNNESVNEQGCIYNTSSSGVNRFPMVVNNTLFDNNYAYQAPAMYISGEAKTYIYGNSFIGNRSDEKGAVTIIAPKNATDIRLVNNTFVNNRIEPDWAMFPSSIGGSAIWQEMASGGSMTLMNNTIVGNYTACWEDEGVSAEDFVGSAIQSEAGKIAVFNNIIAGNYSSCPGRGDISLTDVSQIKAGAKNVFSSSDNMNYVVGESDITADSYASACQSLISMFGGYVGEDQGYYPDVNIYGEQQDIYALSPQTTLYASQDIRILDAAALSASTVGSDILNVGSNSGTLTVDQANNVIDVSAQNSVPGAMIVGAEPTELPQLYSEKKGMKKWMVNGKLMIQVNNHLYDATGRLVY